MGLYVKTAYDVREAFLETIKFTLETGECHDRGVGKVYVTEKADRKGRSSPSHSEILLRVDNPSLCLYFGPEHQAIKAFTTFVISSRLGFRFVLS